MKLLIVDDNEPALREYTKYFQGRGINVAGATTVDDAMKIVGDQGKAFDVSLLDMVMGQDPEAGVALLKEIRRTRPLVQNVILTAFPKPDTYLKTSFEGIFSYLDRAAPPDVVFRFVEEAYARKAGIEYKPQHQPGGLAMRVLGMPKGQVGLRIFEAPLPRYKRNDVVAKTLFLGVCGTDVNSFGGHGTLRRHNLIEFHEAVGEVLEVGCDASDLFSPGDWVIPMVRRCDSWPEPERMEDWSFALERCKRWGECAGRGHPDRCLYGCYLSRGTGKYHGFGSESFSDSAEYLVRVTTRQRDKLRTLCVLAEPLSVAWKLVREIEQRRGIRKMRDRVLVVGVGPIGMLCLTVLRGMYPGLELHAADVCPHSHRKVEVLQQRFHPPVTFHPTQRGQDWDTDLTNSSFDIVIDASGDVADVLSRMCGAVSPEGILGLLGISDESHAAESLDLRVEHVNKIVSRGIKIVGSVCASKQDMEDSLRFMEGICCSDLLADLIHPSALVTPTDAPASIGQFSQSKDYIKIVIDGSAPWR